MEEGTAQKVHLCVVTGCLCCMVLFTSEFRVEFGYAIMCGSCLACWTVLRKIVFGCRIVLETGDVFAKSNL